MNKSLVAKLSLSAVTLSMLTGCMPIQVKNPNYQFSKQTTKGIAAFSLTCYGPEKFWLGRIRYQLRLYQYSNNVLKDLSHNTNLEFYCAPKGYNQNIVLALPGGRYHFSNISYGDMVGNLGKGVNFKVFPRRVTYIGNVNLLLGINPKKPNHFVVGVANRSKRDIPAIRKLIPKIPYKVYHIRIASLNKR